MEPVIRLILERASLTAVLLFLLACAAIYIWYQHQRLKLLKEQIELADARRRDFAAQLESAPEPSPEGKAINRGLEHKVVLIVDDETSVCNYLSLLVETGCPGTVAVTAKDGDEALRKINSMNPSLLILDLMMPGKNGFEVLRELHVRQSRIPIIVVSGYLGPKQEVSERARVPRSFFEYLRKPFFKEDFLEVANRLLSK